MSMEIIALPRAAGKTTLAVRWLREAPEDEIRVLVCHDARSAMLVYRSTLDDENKSTGLASWQFISMEDAMNKASLAAVRRHAKERIVFGVDNVDVALSLLFRTPVEMVTMTHEDDS